MKLTINKAILMKAIALIIDAVDNHHQMTILGNLKLVLEPTRLTLTASDLEVELTNVIALPDEACVEAGEVTIPADKFFGICKALTADVVNIHVVGDRCSIVSGKGKYMLSTLPAKDYPSIGEPRSDKLVKIGKEALFGLIKHTRFAMATQDVRHYLTGLLFEVEGDKLTAVATDGHRLAVAYQTLNEGCEATKVIIPGKAVIGLEKLLVDLLKISEQDGDVVTLGLDEDFLTVSLNFDGQMMVYLTARLIEGKFPDYRRVLPTNNDKIAIFNKEQMVEVLRRVAVVNTKDSPGVLLDFAKSDVVDVISTNREQDEAREEVVVNYTGEPIEISFNESYLRAVLNVLEGDVRLEMVHPTSPTLIYQVGDEQNHQYVVMPMRV
ncbi:MAG: DNA polymerase III subunit beta [Moraxella sp.]|uniref:DNA polymerase III subunit beta n=1 Tax=Moraxella sp. TaxID=479 RepID=UPI0026DAABA4|nr:DNA polymerase III subunit beta [Moraxella sp.]MDO4449538.1 DNA polymerase III subunit beta [Moraxella sp.]